MENNNSDIEKKRMIYALFIPVGIVLILILVFALENGMEWNFAKGGIYPRKATGLLGILTHGFIHADYSHLIHNCIPLFILSTFVCYFYSALECKILLLSYIGSGILLWIFGRPCWHIGASGLVYALCFFLFFSGIFRKHIPLIAISLIVVFLYGSVVWHMFPWQPTDSVSWEGHLAGGITGTILAIVYRKEGPQKPQPIDDDEPETDDDYWKEQKENTDTQNS